MGEVATQFGLRVKRWFQGRRFPLGFDEWCQSTAMPDGGSASVSNFQQDRIGLSASALSDAFTQHIIQGGRWQNVAINHLDDSSTVNLQFHEGRLPLNDRISADSTDIGQLEISGRLCEFSLSGAVVRCLHLPRALPKAILLSNCIIGKIIIPSGVRVSVGLRNCLVGSLAIADASLKKLTVVGGSIANIDCPPADGPNPFVGSVQFSSVSFPTSKSHTTLFEGSHVYSSMHTHLTKHDNLLMANQMRALQLRAERGQERGVVAWLANWIYGTFANYGTSPGRPLIFLGVLYVVTAMAIYRYDGGELPLPIEAYTGSYTLYLDWDGGWLNRSLVLPIQSMLNPFSMFFDVRRYVTPETWQMGVWLTFQGIFSDLMLFLAGVSMRRRFKTS